ncbi:Werner Syndrome-like exonuclease-like [Dorcoceras hygrometricum]|uniref:Werner Syndrome-like exonuclease-like n=1 Tax=Dorcoceras hygrometricum TaxID=472368 RepID=A0A2Z7A0U7_9LAMI|nr:Werner Syndrome-like exonuclease-like [Dorcoceras hygrometricum]
MIHHAIPTTTTATTTTYDVDFYGDCIHTTVTNDCAAVSEWISEVESIHRRRLHHLIVGLDVEWRPPFGRPRNPIATLQLCVGRRCLIYQIIHSLSTPFSLTRFLSNPNYTFVGVGIESDLENLEQDYELGRDVNAVDLRDLAAEEYNIRDSRRKGLKDLARIVLDKEMEKPKRLTLSRWDNTRLSYDQVEYACIDAFVSFEMGRILNASSR